MSRRQIIALLLAVLVLVTSSRAATVCVEEDGTERIEFVGLACCAEPTEPSSENGTTIESNPCAGCADTPFDVTARLKSHDSPLKILITKILIPFPTLLFMGEPKRASIALWPTPRHDGESPRAMGPSRLRC